MDKPQFNSNHLIVGNAYIIESKLDNGCISKDNAILLKSHCFDLTFSKLIKNEEDYIGEFKTIDINVNISDVVNGFIDIKSMIGIITDNEDLDDMDVF